MAISIVNSKNTGTSAVATIAITSATAGNLLVAFIAQNAATAAPTMADSIGSTGWAVNSTDSLYGATSNNSGWVAYKTAVGGETSISFTPGSGGTGEGIAYYEINGADNTPTVDAIVATSQTAAVATLTSGSVTTTNVGDIILAGVFTASSSGTVSAWTGTGPLNNIATTSTHVIGGSLIPGVTESGVTFTANWTTSGRAGMLVIALNVVPSANPTPQTLNNYQFVKDNAGGDTGILSFTEKIK